MEVKYIALMALGILTACLGAALAQSADDPPPAFSPDHCGAPRVQWIYFPADSGTTSDPTMMERISEAARSWTENSGYILLRGHLETSERPNPRQPTRPLDIHLPLDLQRMIFVRDELVARGVHTDAIWLGGVSDADISVPWEPSNPTAGKRRVDLIATNSGDQCRRSIREVRATWALRNCLPDQARDDLRRSRCEGVIRDLAR